MTRKLATIIRTRLCIHASPSNWRIPASTMGYPVRPSAQAAKRASAAAPSSTSMPAISGRRASLAVSGRSNSTDA